MTPELARKSLGSTSQATTISALQTLGKSGQISDLQPVMALVKNPSPQIREAATDATCLLIRENLIVNYSAFEPAVREKLVMLLQSLDPLVLDQIEKDLYAENDERRLRAVQVLGLLRSNPRVRDILAKLIQDRDVKVRATAISLMGKIIGPHDHQVILSLLNDKDKRVRANTVEALEGLGNKRLVPILLRFRRDNNNRIRGNVLKALYNLGFAEIQDDLREMIESSNSFMKASALWVIAQTRITSTAMEDAASYALLSDDQMVLDNARKALEALATPRSAGFMRYLDRGPASAPR